jgi:hypothetical protein
MKRPFWFALVLLSLSLSACSNLLATPTLPSRATFDPHATLAPLPSAFPRIDRQPAPANWERETMTSVPTYNADSDEMWQMDLRAFDLSYLDLTNSLDDLMYADFDSQTKWPTADKMPGLLTGSASWNWARTQV